MRRPRRLVILLVMLLIVIVAFLPLGCSRPVPSPIMIRPPSSSTPTSLPATDALPPPTPTPAPYIKSPTNGLPLYTFFIDLNYATHSLNVESRILVQNNSGESWQEVVLSIPPAYYANTFDLHLATVTTEYHRYLAVPEWENTMLYIPLEKALEPGAPVEIKLEFTLQLPEIELTSWPPVGNFGWSWRLIQMGDWHPTLVPYHSGEGWAIWDYYPVGDPVVYEIGTYDVQLITDAALVVAAPGFVTQQGKIRQYHMEQARSFAFIVSPAYEVVEGNVGETKLQSYYFPEQVEAGNKILALAAEAVTLYETLYGPFPYPSLTIAQNAYYGAMEYSGFISLSTYAYETYNGIPSDLLFSLTVHEIAHQWWYGAVGNNQVYEPWLDESFAKYSELLFLEHYYPDVTDWWWEYNINQWELAEWLDTTIYDYPDTRDYIHAIYGMGARFLSDLRSLMGDEAFFAFTRDYREIHEGQLVTKADFIETLKSHTDVDMTPVLERYLR
ncbi:MAG: M1 family metallopeptidase [Anaerolineae bacterium]|nr:M1 family metallopeptidase [Anaerolineae bacterium]